MEGGAAQTLPAAGPELMDGSMLVVVRGAGAAPLLPTALGSWAMVHAVAGGWLVSRSRIH